MAKKRNQQSIDAYAAGAEQHVIAQATITDSLNNEYREYAKYAVFERAIPHLADGLKITQRKVLAAALKHAKNKCVKISGIQGYVMAEYDYHHGDAGLIAAITNMTQDWKFCLPYLTPEGQAGSVYSPYAAQPRYLKASVSESADLLFKDEELLNYELGVKSNDKTEPVHYLPIVPTVLFNSTDGIAIGYANSIVNKNPRQVINAVFEYLTTGTFSTRKLTPHVNGLKGVWRMFNDRFEHHASWEVYPDKDTIHITSIPYGRVYGQVESHLAWLCESGYLRHFDNLTKDGKIRYICYFHKGALKEELAKDTPYHKLCMFSRVERDNLTVVLPDGKITRFDDEFQLIEYFVKWRLPFYDKRRELKIAQLTSRIDMQTELAKFIDEVATGKIDITTIKDRDTLHDELRTRGYVHVEMLSAVRVYKLTEEERQRALQDIQASIKERDYYVNTSAKDLYILDVKALLDKVNSMPMFDIEYFKED